MTRFFLKRLTLDVSFFLFYILGNIYIHKKFSRLLATTHFKLTIISLILNWAVCKTKMVVCGGTGALSKQHKLWFPQVHAKDIGERFQENHWNKVNPSKHTYHTSTQMNLLMTEIFTVGIYGCLWWSSCFSTLQVS